MGQNAVGPGVPTESVRRGKRPGWWEGLMVWLPLETLNGRSALSYSWASCGKPKAVPLSPLLAGQTGLSAWCLQVLPL